MLKKTIAYLILAHMDPMQFGRLVGALGNNCDIYVHIDKKTDISCFKAAINSSNIHFLSSRVVVSWAGISMIDALNLLIQSALINKERYTHLVFLSGTCYPIKRVDIIQRILTQNPRKEFIKFIDMRKSPEHYMKQITQKWFKEPFLNNAKGKFPIFFDKALRIMLHKFRFNNHWNDKLVPYFGSTWCALTVDCCQYLIDFQKNNPWYRQMNCFTFSPDEHYYHTIIGNSEYKHRATGEQKFEGRGLWRLANFHIIDKSLAKWFTLADWEEIVNSDKMFVRKIRSSDGTDLVMRINKELLA